MTTISFAVTLAAGAARERRYRAEQTPDPQPARPDGDEDGEDFWEVTPADWDDDEDGEESS